MGHSLYPCQPGVQVWVWKPRKIGVNLELGHRISQCNPRMVSTGGRAAASTDHEASELRELSTITHLLQVSPCIPFQASGSHAFPSRPAHYQQLPCQACGFRMHCCSTHCRLGLWLLVSSHFGSVVVGDKYLSTASIETSGPPVLCWNWDLESLT